MKNQRHLTWMINSFRVIKPVSKAIGDYLIGKFVITLRKFVRGNNI